MTERVTIRHAHLFAGLGGGAKGFNQATARIGNLEAEFRCIGGIDVDPAAVKDFGRLAGVPGTLLDLFDRAQFADFHGHQPPADWREATPADVRRAFGDERPDVVFLSAPCKGFSGLLSETKSRTAKYQALNRLTLRGIWLMLEAYADSPVPITLFENVPKIAQRGQKLLGEITALLRSYGYAVSMTNHDCGEIGGLAQSRKRFLLVARHMATVPPFLYEPPTRRLRGVGEVIGRLPMPGSPAAGAMHRMPALRWSTWVRLACVRAGGDWRSLRDLAVEDGVLRDYSLVPERFWHHGALGVTGWDEPMGTVTAGGGATQGTFSVADPRAADGFDRAYRLVAGAGGGRSSPVPDPRARDDMFHNAFRTVGWQQPSQAITGQHAPSNGAMCVADPRASTNYEGRGKYRVTPWEAPSGTVIAASTTGNGAFAVADPMNGERRSAAFGVIPWERPSGTVAGESLPSNGRFAVADPQYSSGNGDGDVPDCALPAPDDRGVAYIRSLDGTWHRPLTTLELAALQSLVDPEEHLELEGLSDAGWRERIGNAVPPDAARAIAETIGRTLLMARSGQGFALSSLPIWVQPIAVALSVAQPEELRRG